MSPLNVDSFIATYEGPIEWIGGCILAGSVFYGLYKAWCLIRDRVKHI